MKKLISLILALTLIFLSVGCNKKNPDNDSSSGSNNVPDENHTFVPTITVPPYKDYGRGSVDFDKIVYSRPDLATVISSFNEKSELISANAASFEDQLKAITELDALYVNVESMYTLTEIYSKKDSSVEFWRDEYLYMSSNYPSFVQAVENLLVACASSEHKAAFEAEYFGYSLNEYVDGGKYTDDLVLLLEQEAIKEAEYSSLSTATVTISYKSVGGYTFEGTVDEVYKQAEERYGKDSIQYKNATVTINELYQKRLSELSLPIYVDLLKIRRLIADELGYDSYTALAYENMGYDYSPNDMLKLLSSVGAYVTPVTERLNSLAFTSYFQKNNQPRVDSITLINTLYSVYKTDSDLQDAYSYMLQHKLYDVAPTDDNRFSGAFTAYIESNASPYVFMSSSGFIRDYTTLSHEFGHFYDGFVNYGSNASTDLAEVSSQGLEYLTLLKLKTLLKTSDYEYLEYLTMYETLNAVLLEQSFYALFEHKAYEIEYDNISTKSLSEVAREAFSEIYGRELEAGVNALPYVVIPHTLLYPFYVESYVSSAIPALEIFFLESYRTGQSGDGLAIYKQLIDRKGADISFTEALSSVGLSSPFDQETVKRIANLMHYQIVGKDYFTSSDNAVDAA